MATVNRLNTKRYKTSNKYISSVDDSVKSYIIVSKLSKLIKNHYGIEVYISLIGTLNRISNKKLLHLKRKYIINKAPCDNLLEDIRK